MIQHYKDYRPTSFDCAGSFLPDQGDWLVAPVGRNRDSGSLDESNFATCLELLGGESTTVEVHRFGHWTCGWFEIILARPDRGNDLQTILDRLNDYPVLDEDDYSQRRWRRAADYYNSLSPRNRYHDYLASTGLSVFAARYDLGELLHRYDADADEVYEHLTCDD